MRESLSNPFDRLMFSGQLVAGNGVVPSARGKDGRGRPSPATRQEVNPEKEREEADRRTNTTDNCATNLLLVLSCSMPSPFPDPRLIASAFQSTATQKCECLVITNHLCKLPGGSPSRILLLNCPKSFVLSSRDRDRARSILEAEATRKESFPTRFFPRL